MGLDMYLSVKKYVNQKDGFGESAVIRPEYLSIVSAAGLDKFTNDESVNIYGAQVSVTAAYWRKANQIHNWFVSNVQDGEDNCQESYVSLDNLKELVSVCAEVLLNKDNPAKCEELLPTGAGFFFGSTEYDEWYFGDVEYTHDRLTELINLLEESSNDSTYYDVYYQASW